MQSPRDISDKKSQWWPIASIAYTFDSSVSRYEVTQGFFSLRFFLLLVVFKN
jgi:hypothetical protein